MLRRWVLCPLQMRSEILERQDAVGMLLEGKHAGTLADIQLALSSIRPVRAACIRIQTELHLVDLEAIAQFAYAIVKLHGLVASMGPAPKLLREVGTASCWLTHSCCPLPRGIC
ncbi:hypothetical protein H4R19_000060 [Coemansia spiralis]|nr:hypothetical protein H4R19_000060 [Coemansia spiralis]